MNSAIPRRLAIIIALAAPAIVAQSTASQQSATQASLPDIIDQVRPSIVRIVVTFKYSYRDGAAPSSPLKVDGAGEIGSGFILDAQGHIGTAAHVVNSNLIEAEIGEQLKSQNKIIVPGSLTDKVIDVSFPVPSSQDTRTGHNNVYNVNDHLIARIFNDDATADIAVLVCPRNPVTSRRGIFIEGVTPPTLATAPKLDTSLPRDGEMIAVSGFPLGIPIMVTTIGWIAASYFRDEKERSLYLASILTNPGNSGGPVYETADGSILGCAVQVRLSTLGNSGLTVIVPIARFQDLLTH